MIVLTNFLSVRQYARLCGVPNRTIYDRVYNKTVSAVKVCGYYFIDVEKSPPEKRVDHRKKHLLVKAVLPPDIDYQNLITVKQFVNRKKMRSDSIYESVILGTLNAVIIGDMVFVDKSEVSSMVEGK